MYNKYFSACIVPAYIIFGIILVAFISGSIFCGIQDSNACMEMHTYLSDFFKSLENINHFSISINKLREYAIILLFLFFSAFFKAGSVFNAGIAARQGFIAGFTLSSFFKSFGFSGISAMLCMLPELILSMTALLIFSSTSTKIAFLPFKSKKNFFLFFIFISLFCGTIFCISAFFSGYFTTTFMRQISAYIL